MLSEDKKQFIEDCRNEIDKQQGFIDEILKEDIKIETLGVITERVNSKPNLPKYATGEKVIDDEMGGFTEGSFINIAGENFTGKTTLVLKILKYISEHNKTLFFSFEMYENLLVRNKFKYSSDNVKANLLIEQNRSDLASIDFMIRNFAKKGVKFFAIDSRMKIRVDGNLQEFQKNSLISQTLSKLTQELGIILILINQIALSDLRNGRLEFKGSGDMSYDSDVSFFILKDETEKRTLVCSKDRINERTWKKDITDYKYVNIAKPSETTTYEMPEIS